MPQQVSEEEQVKFRDVAACFSQEEWKILQDWQKDFYKNVMTEIHQALFLLGYQIVNTDTLLRVYKGKELYAQDYQDAAERRGVNDPFVSSYQAVNPDILFRIAQKEESACRQRQSSKEIGVCDSSSARFPVATAAFSLPTHEDYKLYPPGHESSERRAANHPFLRRVVLPEVFPVNIKEEVICSTDQPDCEIIENISNPRDNGSMNFQKKIGESMHSTKTPSTQAASLEVGKSKERQISHKRSDYKTQLSSESYNATRGNSPTQFESGLSDSGLFSVHQGRAKVRISKKYNDCEINRMNSQFLNVLPKTQQNQKSYTNTEIDKCYNLKSEFTKHIGTHSEMKEFACTDCEKSFSRKYQLTQHHRIHTGEKPHACHLCHKRFRRKDHLDGHIRVHTGEKPYTCTECERSFTWKSEFNLHRRRKHKPIMISDN